MLAEPHPPLATGAVHAVMKTIHLHTRSQWRSWLEKNRHREPEGIWLQFFRKDTGRPTLDYDVAVEEALCFGWIDSIIRRIDEVRYARKFTPRRPDSRWSKSNKDRVERLIKEGRMTPSGLALVRAAKESGLWNEDSGPGITFELPADLAAALQRNPKARRFFDQLAPSYRKRFIGWVDTARRPETRNRRICRSIELLQQQKKLGLK